MALPKTTIHDEELPEVRLLTREEAFEVLDNMTRNQLDMSAEEYLEHWNNGDFKDEDRWDTKLIAIESIGIWALQFVDEA